MKTFLDLARENKVLREEVEIMISGCLSEFQYSKCCNVITGC